MVFGNVGDVVEDQQVIAVELCDRRLKCQLPAGDLQPLNQIGGSGEQDAVAGFDKCEPIGSQGNRISE